MTDEEYWAYIRDIVAGAPPLRPEQISKLSALFGTEVVEKGSVA